MMLARHAAVIIIIVLVLYPFALLISLAFKDNAQFMHQRWMPTLPLHFANFTAATAAMIRYVVNSFIVTTLSCAGIVTLSAFSAYVFAGFEFPGRQSLFYAILSLMMVPGVLGLVPLFMIVRSLGLLDTYWALILPYIAGGQVMGIFLLRTFFAAIPNDLFDASRIDGAGDFRAFTSVAVPLCKPMLATVAIISVQASWNDLI
jgi:ABC-type glycerol-3-phosphate transport system permease component